MGHPLTILTACSRPGNLVALRDSIAFADPRFDIRWIVCHDCSSGPCDIDAPECAEVMHHAERWSVVGHAQVNAALSRVDYGWVYRLDDDNVMHPRFWDVAAEHMGRPRPHGALIMGLSGEDGGVMRAGARHGRVDAAQCLFLRDFIGDARYPLVYHGDGLLVEALWSRSPSQFRFTKEVAAYYNGLKRTLLPVPGGP